MVSGEGVHNVEIEAFDMDHLAQALGHHAIEGFPVLINIGGASASGKSTVSRFLAEQLPDAQVLPVDTYLSEGLWDQTRTFNHESPDPRRPYVGGISPEIWDLDLLEDHVRRIRQGQTVDKPIFDETRKDRVGYEPFTPGKYVILEGGHSFTPMFYQLGAYGILVEAPLHDRLTRKMVRTHAIYGLNDVDEVVGRYLAKDEPVRRVYAEEYAKQADQVVQNPAHPLRDYAHLRPTHGSRPGGNHVALIPRPETGTLREQEKLGLVQTPDDGSWITYEVAGNKLVHLPISAVTENLLSDHYEFRD